ncbi:MAG TPA: DUF58 domain-containing protein [Candidatus Cloacimonadota bacterium]|nr:DUF58 domain-containing protein [Candidatus Cloacimonadota bacterium]HPT72497.1 DUF58 domain-containing protein [Candidatus Cloacimonadota bacterium]
MEKDQLLNESLTAKLDRFHMRTRMIVEGFMVGLHKSPYHGFSVEFADHRQYMPGDAIRNVDWKVYAKTNRWYVKRYEEETNVRTFIILDHSKSMQYGSGDITKLDYTKQLASALAYLVVQQQDAAGLITYTDKVTNYLPPKAYRSYVSILLQKLMVLEPQEQTHTLAVLHGLAEQIRKRSLIIMISDMIDDPDAILSGLNHFRYSHHEVILFHIQDPQEVNFNFKGETEFIDKETGQKVTVMPWQIRNNYRQAYDAFSKYLKVKCHQSNIEYNEITTSTPIEDSLLQYLIKRSRL